MEMKKLVVNGVSYTVADPDAANIDDGKIGPDAWSSKNTVDRLCPLFTESGAMVTCEPIEGYPLKVVSKIEPVQEGNGDPGPDNIRPISGHSAVKLYRNNEEFTIDLGQAVYGGSFHWASGVLTIDGMLLNINPDKISFNGTDETGLAYTTVANQNGLSMDITQRGLCNRLTYVNIGMGASDIGYSFHPGGAGLIRFRFPGVTSLEEAKAWVLENPLQLYYKLAEPITIQLTPREILALSGENTLYSDTGDTEVTGRADPAAIIEKLTNAIVALGGNV